MHIGGGGEQRKEGLGWTGRAQTHKLLVEDERRADAGRQPGEDDQQERKRSILVVFFCGAHPCVEA